MVSTDASPSEDVIRQAKLREDGCSGEPLFITFASVAECAAAVAALHGRDIAVAGGQRQLLWARQLSGEGQHHKKWRLIIRNLSFKVGHAAPAAACTCVFLPTRSHIALMLMPDGNAGAEYLCWCCFGACAGIDGAYEQISCL